MAASEKKLSLLAIVAGGLVGVAMFQNCSPNQVHFNDQVETRVTPGSGRSHEEPVVPPENIPCDGSCR